MEAPESVPVFVQRHATRATRVQLLFVIAATSGFVWLADLVSGRSPLLALGMLLLALSVASVALWGLMYGHATPPGSRLASWAARALLALGMVGGVIAAFAFLLALLGRPWTL